MQVNNQEMGFLRVKDIPGVQRTLQESFLIVRGAFERWLTEAPNYLHSPEQLLAEENCNDYEFSLTQSLSYTIGMPCWNAHHISK